MSKVSVVKHQLKNKSFAEHIYQKQQSDLSRNEQLTDKDKLLRQEKPQLSFK